MLRHAEPADQERLLQYLRQEPEFNVFMIGDILNFGFQSEAVDVFVQQSQDAIEGILLRYRKNLIPYTHDPSLPLLPVAEVINDYLGRDSGWMVSGKKAVVEPLQPKLSLKPRTEVETFLCVCRTVCAQVPLDKLPMVRMAHANDSQEIYSLVRSIPEFGGGPMAPADLSQEIEQGKTRVAIVRDPLSASVVSCAFAVAETDMSAMVIAVCTREGHRRKGYASACVYHLVRGLERRGKSACLFFHNPEAGAIYHRLGFKDIGMWKMLRFRDGSDKPA